MKYINSILLLGALALTSCSNGYGINENQGDNKGMSSSEVKAQQDDISFLEQFYKLYLADKSSDFAPASQSLVDSTGTLMSSPIQWSSMVSDSLLSAVDGIDYDLFLSCQDYPDSLDFSIAPVVDAPGWYEMIYPSFDGTIVTTRLLVGKEGSSRQIIRVKSVLENR